MRKGSDKKAKHPAATKRRGRSARSKKKKRTPSLAKGGRTVETEAEVEDVVETEIIFCASAEVFGVASAPSALEEEEEEGEGGNGGVGGALRALQQLLAPLLHLAAALHDLGARHRSNHHHQQYIADDFAFHNALSLEDLSAASVSEFVALNHATDVYGLDDEIFLDAILQEVVEEHEAEEGPTAAGVQDQLEVEVPSQQRIAVEERIVFRRDLLPDATRRMTAQPSLRFKSRRVTV